MGDKNLNVGNNEWGMKMKSSFCIRLYLKGYEILKGVRA